MNLLVYYRLINKYAFRTISLQLRILNNYLESNKFSILQYNKLLELKYFTEFTFEF